jgi:nucleotide-binding universal stress UspA family protein
MSRPVAYLALESHPEPPADDAIRAAVAMAAALGAGLHLSVHAVDVPPVASPLGGVLIDLEGMSRTVEERSRETCDRLVALVEATAGPGALVATLTHRVALGGVAAAAAVEARYFDLALVPWTAGGQLAQDLAQALVFGTGLPVVLVPGGAGARPLDHLAVAWDESRVAARALGDALRLLAPGGRVSVLTVKGEKALREGDLAATLAAALTLRGIAAEGVEIAAAGRPVAAALQEEALARGAGLMAMGGFGHSRLRDVILGGATRGVLADLRMPVLLAH